MSQEEVRRRLPKTRPAENFQENWTISGKASFSHAEDDNNMLRRNRFGFRLRRRSWSNRLLQVLVVLSVLALFVYFLGYAINWRGDTPMPDYSWLKTRNVSHYVRPEADTTILEPLGTICPKEEKLRLVVIVCSAPANFERRRIIRRTWGRGLRDLPGVRVLFLVGVPSGPGDGEGEAEDVGAGDGDDVGDNVGGVGRGQETQDLIESEHREFNDVVQQDFLDSYMNLTIKTAFALKWVVGNDCVTAKFVFKVDDDAFVNPAVLWDNLDHALLHTTTTKAFLSYLPRPPNGTATSSESSSSSTSRSSVSALPPASESVDYLFMGHVQSAVPIRDPTSKWYLPSRFYPLNIFPRFVSGSGYVFTNSVSRVLYQCAIKTPYMNLEDVFLSGLCAGAQLGLKLTHNPTFHFRKPLVGADYICFYKKSSLIHPMEDADVEPMYDRVLHDDHNCDTFYFAFIQFAKSVVEFFKNLFRV